MSRMQGPRLRQRRNPPRDPEWERLVDEKERLLVDNIRLTAKVMELLALLLEVGVREGRRCLNQ